MRTRTTVRQRPHSPAKALPAIDDDPVAVHRLALHAHQNGLAMHFLSMFGGLCSTAEIRRRIDREISDGGRLN
jgi:hypothetical protein